MSSPANGWRVPKEANMLDSLLTLLLPYRASPTELAFHEQFVLNAYREFYDHLRGTGLRDRKVLSDIKKRTSYSMNILRRQNCYLWSHIRKVHRQADILKKSVLLLSDTELLISP